MKKCATQLHLGKTNKKQMKGNKRINVKSTTLENAKRQMLMTEFSVQLHVCERCKIRFQSDYHLKFHFELNPKHVTSPNPQLGIKKRLVRKSKYRIPLESLNEDILIHVCRYLRLQTLTCFITAFPKLLIVHGMKSIWLIAFAKAIPSKTWIGRKYEQVRDIDQFIVGFDQNRYYYLQDIFSRHQIKAKQYMNSYMCDEGIVDARRNVLWSYEKNWKNLSKKRFSSPLYNFSCFSREEKVNDTLSWIIEDW